MRDSVLVTGAGGFVGSAVVRLLVQAQSRMEAEFADGTPVRHIVALLRPGGSPERLEEVFGIGNWSIEYADVTDRRALSEILARIRPRVVLHVAIDRAAYQDLTPDESYRLNLAPLETLFENLAGVPAARVVHTSSAGVLQLNESVDETPTLQSLLAYARNKAEADRFLPVLEKKTGVKWINLRLFNIFGKYEDGSRVLPYLVACLTQGRIAELSRGDQIRDFNDVDVIAEAYLLALKAPDVACGTVYDIGSGYGISLRAFALTVAQVTGNSHLIRFGARQTWDQNLPYLVADPTLAQSVLRWTPALDLEERVRRCVEWWLERQQPRAVSVKANAWRQ